MTTEREIDFIKQAIYDVIIQYVHLKDLEDRGITCTDIVNEIIAELIKLKLDFAKKEK